MNQTMQKFPLALSALAIQRAAVMGLIAIVTLAASPLPLLTNGPGAPALVEAAEGKNKKKVKAAAHPAACTFKKSGATWKLLANCTITSPINIPDGVTLDGNGKTITMTGAVSDYASANPDVFLADPAILAAGGSATIKNLMIVGSGLTGECFVDTPAAIAFANTGGTIENVSIRNIRVDGPPLACGYGIAIVGSPTKRITVRNSAVNGSPTRGIFATAPFETPASLEISKTRVTMSDTPLGAGTAIDTIGPVSLGLADVTVDVQDADAIAVNMTTFGDAPAARLTVKDLKVQGMAVGGLLVSAFDLPLPMVATIANASLISTSPFGSGLSLSGPITARIDNSAVRVQGFSGLGIFGSTAAVTNSTVAAGDYGFYVAGSASVSVDDATIGQALNGAWVEDNSMLNLNDTVIRGRGATSSQSFGVFYSTGAGGTLDDVAISGFIDTSPETVSCGVAITDDAGVVSIDDVSYPPPGNEQNLCDLVSLNFAASARDGGIKDAGDGLVAAVDGQGTETDVRAVALGDGGKESKRHRDKRRGGHGRH